MALFVPRPSSSSLRSTIQLSTKPATAVVLFFLFLAPTFGQQSSVPSLTFPTTIEWPKQKGITRYRVQIASDENFHNVFLDVQVNGERYKVDGVPPGYYYWRVAPSGSYIGQFVKGTRFFVSGGTIVAPSEKYRRRSRTLTTSNHPRRR